MNIKGATALLAHTLSSESWITSSSNCFSQLVSPQVSDTWSATESSHPEARFTENIVRIRKEDLKIRRENTSLSRALLLLPTAGMQQKTNRQTIIILTATKNEHRKEGDDREAPGFRIPQSVAKPAEARTPDSAPTKKPRPVAVDRRANQKPKKKNPPKATPKWSFSWRKTRRRRIGFPNLNQPSRRGEP